MNNYQKIVEKDFIYYYIIAITYMPTLPIYAVVYRFFLSLLPPTDFRCFPTDFKKNVNFFLS